MAWVAVRQLGDVLVPTYEKYKVVAVETPEQMAMR